MYQDYVKSYEPIANPILKVYYTKIYNTKLNTSKRL